MDSSSTITSSSEDEEEFTCEICDKTVTFGSKNSTFEAHFLQHLSNPKNCGQALYFSRNMPVQETPKSRGGLIQIQPKRNRTLSGPPSTSPIMSKFIHGASPSPRPKPLVHQPDMTRSTPKLVTGNSEPTKKASPLYNVPLKSRQSYPKMYDDDDLDESKKLIEKEDENKKESWYHESEFCAMSKASYATCPRCGGLGPYMCGMNSTGNIFCLSSCLLPFIPFVSCCMPQPSLHMRIFCTRCNYVMMEFNPKERWLIAN